MVRIRTRRILRAYLHAARYMLRACFLNAGCEMASWKWLAVLVQLSLALTSLADDGKESYVRLHEMYLPLCVVCASESLWQIYASLFPEDRVGVRVEFGVRVHLGVRSRV